MKWRAFVSAVPPKNVLSTGVSMTKSNLKPLRKEAVAAQKAYLESLPRWERTRKAFTKAVANELEAIVKVEMPGLEVITNMQAGSATASWKPNILVTDITRGQIMWKPTRQGTWLKYDFDDDSNGPNWSGRRHRTMLYEEVASKNGPVTVKQYRDFCRSLGQRLGVRVRTIITDLDQLDRHIVPAVRRLDGSFTTRTDIEIRRGRAYFKEEAAEEES
jgi:hypothetical protein